MQATLQVQLVYVLVAAMVAVVVTERSYEHNIYVSPNASDANDSEGCHKSEHPCRTLNYAFEFRKDSTQYIINTTTTCNLMEPVPPFQYLHSIAIVGREGGSTVHCQGIDIGLAFISVTELSFMNVSFFGCSATRNSTSRNLTSPSFSLYTFQVGLYFYLCSDVEMTRVNVSYSTDATGVVMYDTSGSNVVKNSIFSHNSISPGGQGGGGFYVEFTFCVPGDSKCNDSQDRFTNVGISYSFDSCVFANNSASNAGGLIEDSTYIIPYRSNDQAFGRGGGLSLFFKGTAMNNTINVTNCHFVGNKALWGGGVSLQFHDESTNNSVLVENCTFVGNSCNYTLNKGTGGGGMRIGHYVYDFYHDPPSADVQGNRIWVTSCNFTSNHAMYGGGMSISPTLQGNGVVKAVAHLTGLLFSRNTGKIGAALHVGIFPLFSLGVVMDVNMVDCSFESNNAHYADIIQKKDSPHTIGVGTVYVNQVPLIFHGDIHFSQNSGSALVAAGCQVDFTETHAEFTNNDGYRGGAISLLGSTYILVNEHTVLNFSGNMASDRGGAIYNRYIEMDNLMTQPNCFLRHADPFLLPDNWRTVFRFANNTDKSGKMDNSIHTSSILPCSRPGGDGYIGNTTEIFCWSNWSYYDRHLEPVRNCYEHVTSEANNIGLESLSVKVIPGKRFDLPLSVLDTFGNDLTNETVFSSTVQYGRSTTLKNYYWGGDALLTGLPNRSINVTLETLGDRIWYIHFTAQLLPCPPGLHSTAGNSSDIASGTCICSSSYGRKLTCDPSTLKVEILDKTWMGRIEGSKEYMAGPCPPSFCKTTTSSHIQLPNVTVGLYKHLCDHNRTGILCGRCVKKFGPAVNSENYECVYCTGINLAANIAKYVSSVYLPLAALFIILIVFDIRLTTGPANAFILYSQVVSSTFSLEADGQIPWNRLNITVSSYEALLKGYKSVYGIFNLEFIENFLSPFCFSSSKFFDTLAVLSLDYAVALFPLLMIIMVVVFLKVRDCCSLPERIVGRRSHLPARWTRSINEALLPAFAAFLLLSYTKFNITASYIISWQYLIDENGTRGAVARAYYAGQYMVNDKAYRLVYLVPSSLVFIVFGCVTPLLLLSYPLTLLEWVLARSTFLWRFYPIDKVHVFLDTFQGCYRNGMRFFAGLYFLFRLAINTAYFATDSWLQQFVFQQIACVVMITLVALCRPYNDENWYLNYVDVFIFVDLAIVNALSLYLYAVSQEDQSPPLSGFVFQYILVFLPLLYMIGYIFWYFAFRRRKWLKRHVKYYANTKLHTLPKKTDGTTTTDDALFFARAEDVNSYQGPSGSGGYQVSVSSDNGEDTRGVGGTGTGTGESAVLLTGGGSSRGVASAGYGTMSINHADSDSDTEYDRKRVKVVTCAVEINST